MKATNVKLQILAVGPVLSSYTEKTTTRKCVLTVSELPADNAFGHNKTNAPAFEIEVYNHNIERFTISESIVGEVVQAEIIINFYKRDGPASPRFLVNDLIFRV